ncbi:hypothetical protein ACIO3O_16415 [Streptomyces sp. NPDC087440]|uniref:hypothetical protein n=1 Tax=Streptomyces sp. NPDC087440 TaxID=3365790 RepID=UPI003830E9A1
MTGSFENHPLNTMIALVEAANPRAVQGAAEALAGVREAFVEAAVELRRRLDGVDWKGEAETEFRRFGRRLADHADDLGAYSGIVAGQLEQAAGGLTSVRNSMPPRSASPGGGLPGGPAEPHRQEALNQLNRLASFYAVSGSTLASTEPPAFDAALRAGVPRPAAASSGGGGAGRTVRTVRTAGDAPAALADPSGTTLPGPRPVLQEPTPASWHEATAHPQTDLPLRDLSSHPATSPAQHATTSVEHPPPTTMELNSLSPGTQPAPPPPATSAQPQAPTPAPAPALPAPGTISGGIAVPLPPRATSTTYGAPSLTPSPGTPGTPATPGSTIGRTGTASPTPLPRPLAGIPGVMGGTPTRTPSATPRPAFTQGGTGLIRPHPQPGAAASRKGRRTAPPSRATEAPETWTPAHPPTTPAVIPPPPNPRSHPHH